MSGNLKPQNRNLSDWEKEQIAPIFLNSLNIAAVSVCEGYSWPDLTNRLSRFVRGLPPPGEGEHNSITLGNSCYFPILLQAVIPPPGDWDFTNMQWLVHELTHAWQYQHTGIGYLYRALWAQIRYKDAAYDYGGPDGLAACRLEGGTLSSFNPEAQAQIVEDYYWLLHVNQDATPYLPYIGDLQTGG